MNLGKLLLVPSLELPEASCYLFDRGYEVVKNEPRPAIHMEKQLGWVYKLCGTVSRNIQGRSNILARLVESQIWHQPAGPVALQREGSEKGQ